MRSTYGLFLLALAALCATCAQAQTSVYGTAGLVNYGFTSTSSNDVTFKGDTGGVGGGAFHNFPIQSRVTVGLDGRVGYTPGYKGGFFAGAALRVGFVPQRVPLRPFFQLGGGLVHSSYNETIYLGSSGLASTYGVAKQSVTSGAAQVVFGLDIRLNDHYDLRAPEIGAQAGGGNGRRAAVSFLNLGVVYHLHPGQRS